MDEKNSELNLHSSEACPIDSMIIMKVKIVHGQAKKKLHMLLCYFSFRYGRIANCSPMAQWPELYLAPVHPSKHMPNVCRFAIKTEEKTDFLLLIPIFRKP